MKGLAILICKVYIRDGMKEGVSMTDFHISKNRKPVRLMLATGNP
jgi:hypothetical protein